MIDKIDVIFPLGLGSYWQDNELRYSLRSIRLFLRNYRNVVIIGKKPRWDIKNVKIIEAKDGQWAATNIYNKLLKACHDPEISDPFLYFNDDHFLTKTFDATNFPYFYRPLLASCLKNRTDYRNTVMNTLSIIGPEAVDFDVHTPMLIRKEHFIKQMEQADWETPHGFCIKSLYAYGMDKSLCTPFEDGKFFQQKSMEQLAYWFSNHAVVSVDDAALSNFAKRFLTNFYLIKSDYE